ncbi:Ribosome biogenesis protein 1 [Pseudocyphellaria aurata]|nr:Ribosome biogenesis protein 1 [Pseudocyphellaria aurata]
MPPTIIDLTQASSPVRPEPDIVPVAVLVKQAISEAAVSRLRSTLVAICDASPEAARIAGSLLLVPEEDVRYLSAEESSEEEVEEEDEEDEEEEEDEEDEEDEEVEKKEDEDMGERSDGKDKAHSHDASDEKRKEDAGSDRIMEQAVKKVKRMRTRYAICENCNEEFDVADNLKGYCCWHEGETLKDL